MLNTMTTLACGNSSCNASATLVSGVVSKSLYVLFKGLEVDSND